MARKQTLGRRLLTLAVMLVSVTAAAEDWLSSYYKRPTPERFIPEVRALRDQGALSDSSHAVPIAVFLGRVMAANPELAGKWLTELEDFRGADRETLLLAASLSGAPDAVAYVRRQPDAKDYEQESVDIRALEPKDPVVLDMLWADFFATGDAAPVRRIIYALNYDKYDGALERYKSSKKTEQDRNDAIRDSVFQAARWSLESNVRKHSRVAEIAEQMLFNDELTQSERLWISVVLAKALPDKYELTRLKPGEWSLKKLQ